MAIQSLTASEFLNQLTLPQPDHAYCFSGMNDSGSELHVNETVDLTRLENFDSSKRLSIEHVHFDQDVIFGRYHFGDAVNLSCCKFAQLLDLRKTRLENGLSFEECIFAGKNVVEGPAILMDDATIRSDLDFDQVTVRGCISARRLRLAGDLKFMACLVEGESLPERGALDLSDSKIKGSIIFESGGQSTSKQVAGGETQPDLKLPRATRPVRTVFRNKREDGASVLLRGAAVSDTIKLAWARFEGEVDLAYIRCRVLESGADIFGRSEDEKVDKKDSIETKNINAQEKFGGAEIKGALTLSGGQFGLVHLYGLNVSGAMMLIAGQSGQIVVEDGVYGSDDKSEAFIVPSRLGHFIMSSWRCSDFIRLHATRISGESNTSRARGIVIKSSTIDREVSFWPGNLMQNVLEAYLEPDCTERAFPQFYAVDEDGKLAPVESNKPGRNLLNRWRRRMIVRGNILIDHCSIGDDLLLTNLDLVAESQPDDGRIAIVDSQIKGNVVFRSPVSFLAEALVDAPLLRLLAQRLISGGQAQRHQVQTVCREDYQEWRNDFDFVPACCHMLDTTGLGAVEIDLTGLCVRRPLQRRHQGGPQPITRTPGKNSELAGKRDENLPNAEMSNLEVKDKIATFARLTDEDALGHFSKIDGYLQAAAWPEKLLALCFGPDVRPTKGSVASVEAASEIVGALHLQHSKIGELRVSDAYFDRHEMDEKAADVGIVLDHAQISKLYVARSRGPGRNAGEHNGFPVPVSLLDFSVKTWFLEDEVGPGNSDYIERETTTASPYLDLLENDPAFRMSSYLMIEKSLRDRGLTAEAKEIFIAGYYRDMRTESAKNDTAMNRQQKSTGLAAAVGQLIEVWKEYWKVWRRGDGRYREGFSIVRSFRLLQASQPGTWVRASVACLAVLLAEGVLFLAPSQAIGRAAMGVALLSFLGLFGAAILRGKKLHRTIVILNGCWAVGAVAGVFLMAVTPSLLSIGYMATIIFSCAATLGICVSKPIRLRHLGAVVYLACFPIALLAVAALLIIPSVLTAVYLLVVLGVVFTLRGNLFRLRRPRREYLGFSMCLAWCVGVICLSVYAVTATSAQDSVVAVWTLAVLIVGVLFLPLLWCFLDQLYCSLVDYGTSALRLAGVIFVLFAISFTFVSGCRTNFESTVLAKVVPAGRWDKGSEPTAKQWTFGERLWMTLRYHVPIVGAIVSEEWQPADHELRFVGLTDDTGKLSPGGWASILQPAWPRARDWYGAMLWLNWILWPLFLPFLFHILLRERN
jgi:hypothetical protein